MRTASRKKLSILSNAIGLKTSSHNYFLFRLKGLKITLRPPTNKHTPKEIISASAPVFGRGFASLLETLEQVMQLPSYSSNPLCLPLYAVHLKESPCPVLSRYPSKDEGSVVLA